MNPWEAGLWIGVVRGQGAGKLAELPRLSETVSTRYLATRLQRTSLQKLLAIILTTGKSGTEQKELW